MMSSMNPNNIQRENLNIQNKNFMTLNNMNNEKKIPVNISPNNPINENEDNLSDLNNEISEGENIYHKNINYEGKRDELFKKYETVDSHLEDERNENNNNCQNNIQDDNNVDENYNENNNNNNNIKIENENFEEMENNNEENNMNYMPNNNNNNLNKINFMSNMFVRNKTENNNNSNNNNNINKEFQFTKKKI